MKKEEFLAFSLPYELKFKNTFRNSINLLTGIKSNDNDSNYEGGVYSHGCYMSWINCTPILHPISDLTKEIEHNGKKFIPNIKLENEFDIEDFDIHLEYLVSREDDGNVYISIEKQLNIVLKLIEWHFDIAGLIERNEAIDVNTLENNPYR